MPKVFDWNGYRFFFYSNEGNPREPVHIHIMRDTAEAKFWLYPTTALAYNYGFGAKELNRLEAIVTNRSAEIEECWHDYFGKS